jgi:hypothetical protein
MMICINHEVGNNEILFRSQSDSIDIIDTKVTGH